MIWFLLDLILNLLVLPRIAWQRWVRGNTAAGWYGVVMFSVLNPQFAGGIKWTSERAYWFRQPARRSIDDYPGAKGDDNEPHVGYFDRRV